MAEPTPSGTRELAVLGVPSSAGAHHAGQELAPGAMRERGLLERLREQGRSVTDVGDVAEEPWRPDAPGARARNLDAVVRVAADVAERVQQELAVDRLPVVIGGDCTITVGVVAGVARTHPDVAGVYLDGDADLSSPDRTRSGILDASGVAHLLGIADNALSRVGDRFPLLAEDAITLLGYDPEDHDSFDAAALDTRPGLVHAGYPELRADPLGCAERAVRAVAGRPFVLHFDVDAVDSGDLALANFPHYGTGVPLATAGLVLDRLCREAGLTAVVLTEVNPTHDPSGVLLDRYLDTIVHAFIDAIG